ncbi:MAG: riboflavin synthase [Opitutales bacterium]|nr:riboflavin synthase [Opitutales bacterium]
MFTGIVEECGRVESFVRSGDGRRLTVCCAAAAEGVATGDSVAVDGCCLTVVEHGDGRLGFDLLEESVRRTRFGVFSGGEGVNLERSVALGGKMGGHIVTGHVDAVGMVESIERVGVDIRMAFRHAPEFSRYVVEKGSIAINGVSLTVGGCGAGSFFVWLIPHTLAVTNLGGLGQGGAVNLEFDIVAKHLEKLALPYLTTAAGSAPPPGRGADILRQN